MLEDILSKFTGGNLNFLQKVILVAWIPIYKRTFARDNISQLCLKHQKYQCCVHC